MENSVIGAANQITQKIADLRQSVKLYALKEKDTTEKPLNHDSMDKFVTELTGNRQSQNSRHFSEFTWLTPKKKLFYLTSVKKLKGDQKWKHPGIQKDLVPF